MSAKEAKRLSQFSKGDLVKQKATGGHVMTVIQVSKDRLSVLASYATPDGVKHDEQWPVSLIKRVDVGL